jgi:glycosyltransferase involved in cell wall biosynthesis
MLRHKNLRTLVVAMSGPELAGAELILAGPLDRDERERLAAWCVAAGVRERVVHLGYVALDELADLYAAASVVALPSLYEGFGLTLLEAMRFGAPVVASSISAHREVGGEAALYVNDPLSSSEWACSLSDVIRDPRVSDRLSADALRRSETITWDAIAAQMEALSRDTVAAGLGLARHAG